jgi:membrane associated rhomboid family serine protease
MKQFYLVSVPTIQKVVITVVLVLWWLFGPVVGTVPMGIEGSGNAAAYAEGWQWMVASHVLYMVSHANFWHLAGNLFVLWMIPNRLYMLEAVIIAFVTSWLPGVGSIWEVLSGEPIGTTVGFSGVLFAIFGIKWGVYCVGQHKGRISRKGRVMDEQRTAISAKRLKMFCVRVLPFALIGFLVPHLNWTIHLYCLTAGLLVGMVRAYNVKYIKA